jgi:hypothetical protein
MLHIFRIQNVTAGLIQAWMELAESGIFEAPIIPDSTALLEATCHLPIHKKDESMAHSGHVSWHVASQRNTSPCFHHQIPAALGGHSSILINMFLILDSHIPSAAGAGLRLVQYHAYSAIHAGAEHIIVVL